MLLVQGEVWFGGVDGGSAFSFDRVAAGVPVKEPDQTALAIEIVPSLVAQERIRFEAEDECRSKVRGGAWI